METISKKLIINPNIKNIYGFLILTHSDILIGTVSKDKKEINYKGKNDFIKKSKGCTANRFARIRFERNAYCVKLIDDNLEKIFVKENQLNILGLIIAGNMNAIKIYLSSKNHKFYLNEYINTIIETEYGGEIGFNEAIVLSVLNC